MQCLRGLGGGQPGTTQAGRIPVGDALIVLRSGGLKAAAYGIHGATAVVMLAISVLLLIA